MPAYELEQQADPEAQLLPAEWAAELDRQAAGLLSIVLELQRKGMDASTYMRAFHSVDRMAQAAREHLAV